MKTSAALAVVVAPIAIAAVLFSQPAAAAKNVNFEATASDTKGGVNVVVKQSSNEAEYVWTINDGGSIVDEIPVEICMTGYDTGWTSLKVAFSATPGGNLGGVMVPAAETFVPVADYANDLPVCRKVTIQIDTGALTLTDPNVAQNFVKNITLGDSNPNPSTGSNKPSADFGPNDDDFINNFKLTVTVQPLGDTGGVSCFLTDSAGNLLTDCDGEVVSESESSDGRFAIVANKKRFEVATNPGQFYYNLVWWNTTGQAQTVDVVVDLVFGVDPNGAQAMHTAVFNGYLDGVSIADFNTANTNGVPQGYDGVASGIDVPAGSSLLVTYHLVWSGIGETVPAGCATNCPAANQLLRVTGTVSGLGIEDESCTTEAYGYLKN